MNRRVRRAAPAAAVGLLLAAACARPPRGMRRLDSGDDNHDFRIDGLHRSLVYVEGGGDFVTRLVVVRLTDWGRRKYRYPDEHILDVDPSGVRDTVGVLVRGSGVENDGARRFLEVSAENGKVLREAPASYGDVVENPFNALPPLPGTGAPPGALRRAPAQSPAPPPGEDGASILSGRVRDDGRTVETVIDAPGRRVERRFPLKAAATDIVYGDGSTLYALEGAPPGTTGVAARIEALDAGTGSRRVVASFPTPIESAAYARGGLLVLRASAGKGDPRHLALVDAVGGVVGLELPWTDGRSEIMAVDPDRRLMFVRMDEGGHESCWAIDFKRPALKAASAYLARARTSIAQGRGGGLLIGTSLALGGLVVALFVAGVARDAL